MCKSILSEKKAGSNKCGYLQYGISSVSGDVRELILLERAFRYSALERIRLGGEIKLKLRPVIKSHPTLRMKSRGHRYECEMWLRSVRCLLFGPAEQYTAAWDVFLNIRQLSIENSSEWQLWWLWQLKTEKHVISTAGTEQKCVKPHIVVFAGCPDLSYFILAFILRYNWTKLWHYWQFLKRMSGGSFYTFIMKVSVHVLSRVVVFIAWKRSEVFI